MTLDEKEALLRKALRRTNGLVVAFSGGVDSSLLTAVAAQELKDRVVAVTAKSPTYPARELRDAVELAGRLGVRHETVESRELELPGFADNPADRCYHCKKELLALLKQVAGRHGFGFVAEGTNADDSGDYRPGRRAVIEAGVLSPLLDAGLGKGEIRELSARMGLPTSGKPPAACLASRFPYGTRISREKLRMLETAEEGLRRLGFGQVRVRCHGDVARIELAPGEFARAVEPGCRDAVVGAVRGAGFLYAALDLEGYSTGSMNRQLEKTGKAGDAGS